jgi:hypothetical protein
MGTIRDKEYGKKLSGPIGSLQAGYREGSEVREDSALLRADRKASCS